MVAYSYCYDFNGLSIYIDKENLDFNINRNQNQDVIDELKRLLKNYKYLCEHERLTVERSLNAFKEMTKTELLEYARKSAMDFNPFLAIYQLYLTKKFTYAELNLIHIECLVVNRSVSFMMQVDVEVKYKPH